MKILWVSDSPTVATGFGNVTRHVCAGLIDRGHHISIICAGLTSGQPTHWYNSMLYPIETSADEVSNYLRQLQPDVLVAAADIWWLAYYNFPVITDFIRTTGVPLALHYPVKGDMGEKRLPPSWVRILKSVDLPIAMSRYGRDVTQANGVEPAYIPHGVDTKIFEPSANKQAAKRIFGYEDKFVILSDARNQPHKMLPRTLEIFRRFAIDKDDVVLHLHCDPDDALARSPNYCYDLRSDIAFLNLSEKVSLTKNLSIFTGLPLEQLAQLYQAADVHLLASCGEGFGLPTLQAAASGVVPLASDYSASQELVGNHGEAISISHLLLDDFGLRCALIDIEDAVSKLEKLYSDRQLLARQAQNSREFALSYDWESIIPQWEELLQRAATSRKANRHSSVNAPSIPDDPSEEEDPFDLAHIKRKAAELEIEVRQDMRPECAIRIPVTLPLTKSKQRIPGCVYAASQRDVPSVLALHRIFPGLKVWSTIPLDFDSSVSNGKLLQAKVVQANSAQYRPNLAMSTLALDMGSCDPLLPVEAAKLGVPCIGLAQQKEQAWLWPDFSLAKPDPIMAAELGRQMLTDQGVAAEVCLRARQCLAGAVVGSELQVH